VSLTVTDFESFFKDCDRYRKACAAQARGIDFETFFDRCPGDGPFPWQKRLCAELLAGKWPRVIGLPTASGKTALIDIAVFAMAAGAEGACRRIAFVVDRRVVVDEASERAEQLAGSLAMSPTEAVGKIAKRLRDIGTTESPLVVSTLRGGIPPDEDWAKTPTQPVVLLSTVDQVGSRMLFRAYGRHGPRSWPIHAGLLGRDTLIILDEAHCSRPFCQTMGSIIERYQSWAEIAVGRPARFVMMSGTAADEPDFRLEDVSKRGEQLEPRLTTSKSARLVPVKSSSSERGPLVDRIISETTGLLSHPRVIGVVVNRVADARTIFDRLDLPFERKLLLTGRTRSLDRDRLLDTWRPRLRAATTRATLDESIVVVATQCIEVGANLDFDILVTECAAFDSLRQRFGRLNRLGLQPKADAVIVGFEKPDDDPVYGASLARTWAYLWANATISTKKQGRKKIEERHVDFGVDALDSLLAGSPPEDGVVSLCAPTADAPLLLPAHLDLLAQTNPPPDPSPDVGELLHGLGSQSADVTIVWRADLESGSAATWTNRITIQPPSVGEGCQVPIWAARKWLESSPTPDPFGDIEGLDQDYEAAEGAVGTRRRVLRWRGSSDASVIGASALKPGDVIVAPAAWGACDRYGWNPTETAAVIDIGDAAAAAYRARPVLRLHSALVSGWLREGATLDADIEAVVEVLRDPDSGPVAARNALDRLATHPAIAEWVRSVCGALRDRGCRLVDADGSVALIGRPSRAGADPEVSTSEDSSSSTAMATLSDHSAGVECWARRLAAGCALGSDELVDALSFAGFLHDVGKADPRFQVWLYGGDEVAAAAAPALLAKSDANPRDKAARERARVRAGYPKGTRHEMLSVAMITAAETLKADAARRRLDWDLVVHLVASHHGFARPFAPVAEDDAEPVEVTLTHRGCVLRARSDHDLHRLDSGIADRFWLLVRRYGWHGLSYLEAILRLADHRRSEEEERAALFRRVRP
jgi:CRISPR-associated endonuclease/helicase Cas3